MAYLGIEEAERSLKSARSVAVIGIKPDSRHHLDAHQIPRYLQGVGYDIIPVPVRYPEDATRLLDAGLAVVEDCIGCRRATIWPSWAPLEGQDAVELLARGR
jgi:predicted CoA-binding protein